MSFKTDNYEVVRNVIPEPLFKAAQEYYKILVHQDIFESRHLTAVTQPAYDRYCDAFTIVIQEFLHPVMEERTGLNLLPTFNYTRVYKPKTALKAHTDRPCCEISASLTIANEPNEIWPLYVRDTTKDQTIAVELNPGDMLIYRGMDLPHWRDEGEIEQTGLFMHWVDANGSYVEESGDPNQKDLPRNIGALNDKRRLKKVDQEVPPILFK